LYLRGFTSKGKGGVQERGGARVGKGKKGKKGKERARKRKEKGGKMGGKKKSRKGVLDKPILVCFRCH